MYDPSLYYTRKTDALTFSRNIFEVKFLKYYSVYLIQLQARALWAPGPGVTLQLFPRSVRLCDGEQTTPYSQKI